jgi:ABC-type nitrate/sulfonate/bicarbonate transport system substrate-binding protein
LPFVLLVPSAMALSSAPAAQFVVWPQGDVHSAKDLNGKTIGAESVSGLVRLSSIAWIDRNGGDSKTVSFVELPPAEIVAALERGTVAAATLGPPMLNLALPKVRILGNAFDALGPRLIVDSWFTTSDWRAKSGRCRGVCKRDNRGCSLG